MSLPYLVLYVYESNTKGDPHIPHTRVPKVTTHTYTEMSMLLRLLDADSLTAVLAHVSASDAFPTALACRAFCSILRARFPYGFRSGKIEAFAGSVARAQWALEHGCADEDKVVHWTPYHSRERLMARAGNWTVLEWALRTSWRQDCTDVAINALASEGHLDILKRFHALQRFPSDRLGVAMYYAAGGGHKQVLEWLRGLDKTRNPFQWHFTELTAAAQSGNVATLRWMKACDPRPSEEIVTSILWAAESGSVPMMEYAWEDTKLHLCGNDEEIFVEEWEASGYYADCFEIAASKGHMEVMQWLRAKGFRPMYDAFERAVDGAHWEVADWVVATIPLDVEELEGDREDPHVRAWLDARVA